MKTDDHWCPGWAPSYTAAPARGGDRTQNRQDRDIMSTGPASREGAEADLGVMHCQWQARFFMNYHTHPSHGP